MSEDSCFPHDKIVDLVEQALTRKGYTTCREPAIPTPVGIRKPNLVVSRGSAVTVLDVTVVADNADLALSHGQKCEYYDTPAVREWVRDRYGPGEVTFSAVALNWRGSMAIPSARGLRSLGVSGALLGLISFLTLERGSWIVNHFRRSAYKVRQYDGVFTFPMGSAQCSAGMARFKLPAYHQQKKSKNPGLQRVGGEGKAIVWREPLPTELW